jgi:hypothetical protein
MPNLGYRKKSSPGSEVIGEMQDTSASQAEQLASSGQALAAESHLLKTIGWISAALGAVAIGLIVGREIRQRYKFNRRTPYDLYAHSGDELPDADCSVGI